jgi:RNA polymerase sigma-70 factor (family 1)
MLHSPFTIHADSLLLQGTSVMTTTPAFNETALLQRLQAGEEEAFSEIYNQFAAPLTSFAAARLTSLEEAHDIIHDLFVHLWQERENITIRVSLAAFLMAAVRYRIIDHIRRNSIKKKYAEQISKMPIHVQEEAENLVYEKELREKLESAIGQLSPRVQEVFRLSRFHHLSNSEIAQKLQTSEQTVKNQICTALAQLRTILGKLQFLLWWL